MQNKAERVWSGAWVLWHHLLVTLENYINTNATFVLFAFQSPRSWSSFKPLSLMPLMYFFCLIFQNKFMDGSKWFSADISVTCAFMLRNYEVTLTSCDYLRLNGAWNNAYLFTTTSSIYVFITNSHQMQTATCSCVIRALTDAVSGDADKPQFLCVYILFFFFPEIQCHVTEGEVHNLMWMIALYLPKSISWHLWADFWFQCIIFLFLFSMQPRSSQVWR